MGQPRTTQVLIIGGGATGTGVARDLSLRGVSCILVEKSDLNAGASGANHGLLHSGARYVASDPEAAKECRDEALVLRRLAPHCVEDTGGLFVAVQGDDERYIADFPGLCASCGLPVERIDTGLARDMEPCLSPDLIAAYRVGDATIDPFRLSLDNAADAQSHGAHILRHTRVVGFDIADGRVCRTHLRHSPSGESTVIEAQCIVDAAGAWAGEIADMAAITLPMVYSKGSLLVTQERIAHRVINRLRRATDGDILVPGGTTSILGTTSVRIPSPDNIRPQVTEVDAIIEEGAAMIPSLATTRYIRAYSGVRPLINLSDSCNDRCVSRGFVLLDHGEHGVSNMVTITGGKLTTYRLMAEKTADLVCEKIGVDAPCRTRTLILPDTAEGHWTKPGAAPGQWFSGPRMKEALLCECEMVPGSVIDAILGHLTAAGSPTSLEAIGLRSRLGKGPCQGAYCSLRVLAYLYDHNERSGADGLEDARSFIRERWKGLYPLLWDMPMVQAELQEALHCGFLNLEVDAPPAGSGEP